MASRLIIPTTAFCLALAACSPGGTTEQKDTAAAGDTLKAQPVTDCNVLRAKAHTTDSLIMASNAMNPALAARAIADFEAYGTSCTDSMAPVFLMKAGQVATSVMNVKKAQSLFETCIANFPNYKNRGAAMFLLAQLYDESMMLNNEAEAKKLYERIIKEYPNSVWENQARAAIHNLGKSDAELIDEFMKKDKAI